MRMRRALYGEEERKTGKSANEYPCTSTSTSLFSTAGHNNNNDNNDNNNNNNNNHNNNNYTLQHIPR